MQRIKINLQNLIQYNIPKPFDLTPDNFVGSQMSLIVRREQQIFQQCRRPGIAMAGFY